MTRPSPSLREVQELVWRLVVAPEGAARGAAELRKAGVLSSEDLSFLVRSDDRMSAVEHVDVYADMYFYRLRDCLAEDFPAVRAVLGADRFHDLVTDYVLANPPAHFSLRELGRALPGFLGRHRLSRTLEAIPDLARLEWARLDVFDERDATPLARGRLLEGAAGAPAAFAFRLIPASRVERVAASVLPVWKRVRDGGEPDAHACRVRGDAPAVLVWRRGGTVFHRSLPADEARCLEAAHARPVSVAHLGDLLLEGLPEAALEQVPSRLAAFLESWSRDEILVETGCDAAGRPGADGGWG